MSGDLWICRACDLHSLATELRPHHILSIAEPGSSLVITAGVPFGTPGSTNLLRIAWVR